MIFDVLDILGTITFAISGVLTAFEKRLDTFSAQKSAIEIKMAAPGFHYRSNASDIAL